MKIQNINRQQQFNNRKQQEENKPQNFTGAFDAFTLGLRFLETNQAWGANAVDLASMVIPRTAVDFYNRGPEAGTETMRREASGTVNHSLVGLYGTIAGLALASTINDKFGIKAHKLFVDDETYDFMAKSFDANKGNDYKKHLENVFTNIETFVDGEWKTLKPDEVTDVVSKYNNALSSPQTPDLLNKELLSFSKSKIMQATGSENNYRFVNGKGTFSLSSGLENIYNVSKALISKEERGIPTEEFLKTMKKMNLRRSLMGLGIASAVGMSIQPINIYLTKKKTGSDGFVGVEGRSKDNSLGFKGLKTTAAALFGGGILASIGMKDGIKSIINKVQFKGLVPTLDQFKFIYGVTIMSRFMAARDKDELRESVVKDVLGFFNWLILGNFVAKITANALDKNLLNYSEKEHGKGFFKKILNAPLKTRDEVLHSGLKAAGIDTIEHGKALSFRRLLKKLNSKEVSESVAKMTKGKLRALSIAQLAGYAYSGLVLGVGIPKLNIYMTNKSEAKRKAKLAAEKANNPVQPAKSDSLQVGRMMSPENLEFLSKNM